MTHSKALPSPFLARPGALTAAERAVSARHLDRCRGARRLPALALAVLFVLAGNLGAGYAQDGELVGTITRTGHGGHPYRWAAPSC